MTTVSNPNMQQTRSNSICLYDTTLRDGAQRRGLSFSLSDKLKITKILDDLGVSYIEGGWPGSNPKDMEYFSKIQTSRPRNAKVVAFGSTRRAAVGVEEDANLAALIQAGTPTVTIVGKSWTVHVTDVLRTSLDENLNMIAESVSFLKQQGKEVIYDAEHFFDGFHAHRDYAMRTIMTAQKAGADWVVLCDTNGGSLPNYVTEVVKYVTDRLIIPVGIHAHNDCELAVANSLAAVQVGATQVQGTINGYGERCGNANLVSIIPTLELKMGYNCIASGYLRSVTEVSRTVSEIANLNPDNCAAYVGSSAFAHKAGLHVAAVERLTSSYEHIDPELVGNVRQVTVSELSGRGNIRMFARELGVQVVGTEQNILKDIKALEEKGFQFENAEGTVELMMRRKAPDYEAPFELIDTMVLVSRSMNNVTSIRAMPCVARTEHGSSPTPGYLGNDLLASDRGTKDLSADATVKIKVGNEVFHTAADGRGPVHALDRALRKALLSSYPELNEVRLADYKVRILDPDQATDATTRVVIEATCGDERWSTVGCSPNIIEASCQALADSLELYLLRKRSKEEETSNEKSSSSHLRTWSTCEEIRAIG